MDMDTMARMLGQAMNQGGRGSAAPGTYQSMAPPVPQPPPGVLRVKVFSLDLSELSGDVITEEVNRWIGRMEGRAVAMQPSILAVGDRLVVAVLYRDVTNDDQVGEENREKTVGGNEPS